MDVIAALREAYRSLLLTIKFLQRPLHRSGASTTRHDDVEVVVMVPHLADVDSLPHKAKFQARVVADCCVVPTSLKTQSST